MLIAACVAVLVAPPQICAHPVPLDPVAPEIETTLAAVNAAASAARWASALAS
jgi:hypothetical protein